MHPLPPPPSKDDSASAPDKQTGQLRPSASVLQQAPVAQGPSSHPPSQVSVDGRKKRRHRGGKKKRNRRQSFAAPSETSTVPNLPDDHRTSLDLMELPTHSSGGRRPIYRGPAVGNLSSTSLDSEILLDHRDYPVRPRGESRVAQNTFGPYRVGSSPKNTVQAHRPDNGHTAPPRYARHTSKHPRTQDRSEEDSDNEDGERAHDRTPLVPGSMRNAASSDQRHGYGGFSSTYVSSQPRQDSSSSRSSRARRRAPSRGHSFPQFDQDYNVNNPPSVPPSPKMGTETAFDDVMMAGGDFGRLTRSPESRKDFSSYGKDALIDVDDRAQSVPDLLSPTTSLNAEPETMKRRKTMSMPPEGDVCYPVEGMSEIADEDFAPQDHHEQYRASSRRRRRHRWPQLAALDEWRREEKEQRSEGIRTKKISEPMLVEGRLRPAKGGWHRTEEDTPYRYTYFNEELPSTLHAQTISELVQPGGSFRELFIPDPPELSDESSEDEEDLIGLSDYVGEKKVLSPKEEELVPSRLQSMLGESKPDSRATSRPVSGEGTPQKEAVVTPNGKRYGPRPTFWLDVLSPTDAEMRVLCKAFAIHALTAEDIMMQETREKVELFRHYYFINYRTFEQDMNSEDYLEPVNMYVIVFREGVLSFHFSQSPHPANVRRRIRQLSDYLILSSDWISYAIIDDITDVFQPLISSIEVEVDDIDETVLRFFQDSDEEESARNSLNEKRSINSDREGSSGIDLLRRVGECRKKVMGLYRLLGNKADVIKGFAKRCNEQWDVAPKSEIGLYLGDIQDHILTMTGNLGHYETLLSRAHSNYLAQINIRMNERQEQTSDILGKLTVVGTIVLPMNIICGMWGMNVKVPGQDIDNLIWFWSITAGLIIFAVSCFFWAKRVYGIV